MISVGPFNSAYSVCPCHGTKVSESPGSAGAVQVIFPRQSLALVQQVVGWVPNGLGAGFGRRWMAAAPPWVSGQSPQTPWVLSCCRRTGMPSPDVTQVWGPQHRTPTSSPRQAQQSSSVPNFSSSFPLLFPRFSSPAALPQGHAPQAFSSCLPSPSPQPSSSPPHPLPSCPNSTRSEVIFLWCKSQRKQVNNRKQSGPFFSPYTCLPLN